MKKEYTSATRIQELVKNYSQFISFPIYVGTEKHRQVEVGFYFLCLYFASDIPYHVPCVRLLVYAVGEG